ncbi:translocase of outer mitochondrial membrane [Pichia californica]|uniref:Translocase of outer mitochondrial membrane n=1 Tax=Pichia californica TaxID=460514 RepID=A0A9P6WPE8_9ASCO|nr:translocase of outer mitochondrial membrane [[Candida] californica]KAG0690855.1 translocase of outer mitochondrial membrane [[Candida] californica]
MAAPSISDMKNLSPLAGVYPVAPAASEPGIWVTNPVSQFLSSVSQTIIQHRNSLDLVNPGIMENINKEISKDVFLSLYQFTGLKADINKTFSMNPAFQIAHSFAIGSKLPSYSFTSIIANDKALVQGTIDNEFSLTGRLNYSWDKHIFSKVSLQLAHGQPSMCQLEHEYQANDFSVQLKALNPDITGPSYHGLLIGSLLQSITSKLSLGMETVYNAMDPNGPAQAAISLAGRYNAGDWIASAQLQAQGALVGSYWRKVAPNLEAGLETTIQASTQPVMSESMMMPTIQTTIEANTVLGAKYEFRQSIYRGQLESNGDVSFMLEHRILPTIGLIFNGSINQFKNTSKLGCGIQIETAGNEDIMMMQNGMIDANGNPIQGAPPMN